MAGYLRLEALYHLAITTGLRQGELLGLRWSDLNWQTVRLHVQRQVQRITGQGLVFSEPKSNLIFPSTFGTPMDPRNLSKQFKHLLKQAGLPDIRFHDLRHTAATLMFQQGVHPKIVQERLGHSSISITLDTYLHVLPSLQEDAADKLDILLQ